MPSERVESLTDRFIEELSSTGDPNAFRSASNALKNALKQASGQEPKQMPTYYKKASEGATMEW